jgi:hypothetical protein
MSIYFVPLLAAALLLPVGLYRARVLGMRWRDTGWPQLTVAIVLYLVGSVLAAGAR